MALLKFFFFFLYLCFKDLSCFIILKLWASWILWYISQKGTFTNERHWLFKKELKTFLWVKLRKTNHYYHYFNKKLQISVNWQTYVSLGKGYQLVKNHRKVLWCLDNSEMYFYSEKLIMALNECNKKQYNVLLKSK